jgi:PAS domain S-box-containing protein
MDVNSKQNNSNRLLPAATYQAVFERAAVGMAIIDTDNAFYEINQTFCNYLGFDCTGLIGKRFTEFLQPADVAAYEQARENVLTKQAAAITLELRFSTCDVRPMYARVSLEHVGCDCGTPCLLVQVLDITENKTQSLREWQDVFQYANWGVVLGTADGMLLEHMNPAFARMHGYSVEELRGRPILDVFAPESRASVAAHIEKAHQQGHYSFESVHLRKDATTFPVFIDVTTVYGNHGEIKYRVVNVQDITKSKEVEKVLQQYATIIESSDDAIISVTPDGIVSSWNRGAETMFGYSANDMIGKSVDVVTPEDRRDEEAIILRRIRNSEHFKNYETVRQHKDGKLIDISVTISPIYGHGGKSIGAVLISRDIGKYKQMEEELLYRENKFRTLAENSPNVIIRYDRECRRVYVNPAYIKESGFTIKEAVNTTIDSQWLPGFSMSVDEYKARLLQVMNTGNPTELVLEWPHRITGQHTTYAFQIVAERSRDGKVLGALVIGHNITALKEAEKHLAESHAQLRELAARREATREDERRHIAREIHDEFGQLLTAIRMEVSMLKQQYAQSHSQFQDSAQRIVALVDRTILEVRNMASMLRPAALETGIVAALEWLADEFTARTGTPCELHLGEEIFNLDESYSIAIFRIVQEALTNIARHAEADAVTIVLERKGVGYNLKVSDTGKGFDVTTKKVHSLGLIGVRERVFMLDGEMTINSLPGQGTMLEVYLPERVSELRN